MGDDCKLFVAKMPEDQGSGSPSCPFAVDVGGDLWRPQAPSGFPPPKTRGAVETAELGFESAQVFRGTSLFYWFSGTESGKSFYSDVKGNGMHLLRNLGEIWATWLQSYELCCLCSEKLD